MKDCYSYVCSPRHLAVVDVHFCVGMRMWVVSRVNVPAPFRRRGIATRLMGEVLEDADNEEVWLALWVNPYGDMTAEQLVDWYKRLGFEPASGADDDAGCMVRPPQGSAE